MDHRIKIFGIIAIIGFIAGVIAQLAATYFVPWLISVLPSLSSLTKYIVTGIVGAVLAIIFIAVWIRITGNRDSY